MKTFPRPFLISAFLALFFASNFTLFAQDATPAAAPATDTPAATAAPSETPPAEAPAAESAPAAPETPPPAEAAPTPTTPATETAATPTEDPELRRIDEPVPPPAPAPERPRRRRSSSSDEFPLGDHVIPKGGHTHEAVSIFGSTTLEGEAASDAVSVFGDTTIGPEAEVHGGAVAVMGRLDVQGRVHGDAVNVLGKSTINAHVGGQAVAVLSDLHLGPKAVVDGDLVLVGGQLTRDPAAVVNGNEVRVPILGGFGGFDGLAAWIKKCLLFGRPLAFSSDVLWAWWVALAFLGLYTVFALLFRGGVDKCVQTFETRPGSTIIAAVLTVLLAPVLTVLLVATMIGAVLVPFLGIALFFATLFGKAVVLAWLGRRITKLFGDGPLNHPAVAVIVGGAIVLVLYTMPILGFIIYKLLGVLGLGVVIYTLILRSQREKAPAVAGMPPRVPPTAAPVAYATVPPSVGAPASNFIPANAPDIGGAGPAVAAEPPGMAPTPSALPNVPLNTLPRAGFWIRTGALALDVVLVAVVLGFVVGMLPSFLGFSHGPGSMLPVLAIYGAVMWKLKGTTIGGIICGLRVVRVDGRELDWATTIVRALGCFLSLVVAGLGFIWVVIDDDKQSWHDKIAGTTVVRVPKGMTLV